MTSASFWLSLPVHAAAYADCKKVFVNVRRQEPQTARDITTSVKTLPAVIVTETL